jgi:cytochrome c biogenesis protein CcdA/thiol-disulfide isomerase/thioredoxin
MASQLMNIEFVNAGLAFIEGAALILSPCILPILPIVLLGSLEGGNKRSYGIICGFVLTFALFTLFSRILVQSLGINLDLLRQIAYGLIVIFGLILFSDTLSNKFSAFAQKIANVGQSISPTQSLNFWSGILLGAAISLIWVPCAGPILAAAIVQSAVQKTSLQSFLIFFFFALGSVIPMILIALVGRKFIDKMQALKSNAHTLRKIFGVVIILSAIFAAFMSSPLSFSMAATNQSPSVANNEFTLEHALKQPYPAPSLQKVDAWINTEPFTLENLKGKVVLIDFWTFSCINCIRTLPYIKNWYEKYHADGLVVIGVHTPEFEFEKNIDNVKKAISQYQISYPVILDNQYGTWQSFRNQYWPAHFLIDKNGMVVYEHFGEGNYDITEHNIVALLGAKPKISTFEKSDDNMILMLRQTPETYLGYARANNFNGEEVLTHDETILFKYPASLPKNGWALQGKWKVNAEKIVSQEKYAAIQIHFFAKKVFVVMGSIDNKPLKIKVLLDGVQENEITISEPKLYEVLNMPSPKSGVLELITEDEGAELYTFTFGN